MPLLLGFPAVPKYVAVERAATRSLSEPDKRLSTSSSSVGGSASLCSSTGIEVDADLHAEPAYDMQRIPVLIPVVRLGPDLAVEPSVQNARGVVELAPASVSRRGTDSNLRQLRGLASLEQGPIGVCTPTVAL
jgi:alpha-ketoglutarate-dependent taurine dioxygenase